MKLHILEMIGFGLMFAGLIAIFLSYPLDGTPMMAVAGFSCLFTVITGGVLLIVGQTKRFNGQ